MKFDYEGYKEKAKFMLPDEGESCSLLIRKPIMLGTTDTYHESMGSQSFYSMSKPKKKS